MMVIFRQPHRGAAQLAICALLLTVAACSNVSGTGAWEEPRPANVPYQRVLVIGVSPESRMRRSFEQQMAEALNASGATRATSSVYVESQMNVAALTKERVIAMIEKIDADAVLVTRMVGDTVKEGRTKEEEILKIGPTVTIDQTVNVTAVWVSDFNLTHVPGQIEAEEDVRIEATVYDVASRGKPVYRVEVEDKFKNASADIIPDVAGEVASVIARELHRDGVVH
jgi:hypothetical protein